MADSSSNVRRHLQLFGIGRSSSLETSSSGSILSPRYAETGSPSACSSGQRQDQPRRQLPQQQPIGASSARRATVDGSAKFSTKPPPQSTGDVSGSRRQTQQQTSRTVSNIHKIPKRPAGDRGHHHHHHDHHAKVNASWPIDASKLESFGEALSKELLKTGEEYNVFTFHEAMERRYDGVPVNERHVAVHAAICTAKEVATLAIAALTKRGDKRLVGQLTRFACCFNQTGGPTTARSVAKTTPIKQRKKSRVARVASEETKSSEEEVNVTGGDETDDTDVEERYGDEGSAVVADTTNQEDVAAEPPTAAAAATAAREEKPQRKRSPDAVVAGSRDPRIKMPKLEIVSVSSVADGGLNSWRIPRLKETSPTEVKTAATTEKSSTPAATVTTKLEHHVDEIQKYVVVNEELRDSSDRPVGKDVVVDLRRQQQQQRLARPPDVTSPCTRRSAPSTPAAATVTTKLEHHVDEIQKYVGVDEELRDNSDRRVREDVVVDLRQQQQRLARPPALSTLYQLTEAGEFIHTSRRNGVAVPTSSSWRAREYGVMVRRETNEAHGDPLLSVVIHGVPESDDGDDECTASSDEYFCQKLLQSIGVVSLQDVASTRRMGTRRSPAQRRALLVNFRTCLGADSVLSNVGKLTCCMHRGISIQRYCPPRWGGHAGNVLDNSPPVPYRRRVMEQIDAMFPM